MSESMLHTTIWCFLSELKLLTKMCNVWTRKYEVVCPNLCYTRKYVMSEPDMSYHMLNAKIWCPVSKLMLHTKMHNVQTNLCYTLKYYVVSTKWCYIPQYCMFESISHTKIWCFVSALMLHTKICNVRTCYSRIWDVFCPILCYIWTWNMSERILHITRTTWTWKIMFIWGEFQPFNRT